MGTASLHAIGADTSRADGRIEGLVVLSALQERRNDEERVMSSGSVRRGSCWPSCDWDHACDENGFLVSG